jgi:hypothetical protein
MDPSDVKLMMEHLMARMNDNQARMEAKMDSNQERTDAAQHDMKVQMGGLGSMMDADRKADTEESMADKAEMMSQIGEMMNRMDNNKEEMKDAINSNRSELEGNIMGQMEYAWRLQTNRTGPFVRSLTRRLRKQSNVYRRPSAQLSWTSEAK